MAGARASGLVEGKPVELADQFAKLLFGDLLMDLCLGVAERPTPRDGARHARDAAAAFLRLHPSPGAG
jgi:hypothetical protein